MKLLDSFKKIFLEIPQVKNKILETENKNLRHTFDILSATDTVASTYTGNAYTTYDSQVTAISAKYQGLDDWGNQIVKNIIDVRSAFIVGNGIKPYKKQESGGERELEFINAFIEFNNLDEECPQEWAKEAEIEGKWLGHIAVDKSIGETAATGGQIAIRHIPYTAQKYTVTAKSDDYAVYEKVTYKQSDSEGKQTGKTITYLPDEFIYKKFGGRTSTVNTPNPKISQVLKSIEDIDKALYDLRAINHLFASPTPTIVCETPETAEELNRTLTDINWKVGKLLILAGADYKMVSPDMQGVVALENEIITKSKIISGAVGIPIHFLGFADLMSNRATADNLFELIWASTSKERHVWSGAYEEICKKVLRMANNQLNAGFDEDAIGISIIELSASKLQELRSVWLDLYVAGGISLETFLSHVPDIEIEEELERIETKQEESLKRMQNQFDHEEDQNAGEE